MDANWGHVAVSVRDMDKAVSFYRDALGFEVEWDMPERGGELLSQVVGMPEANAHIVMLKGYGTKIELFKWRSPEGQQQPICQQCDFGITHFAFSVRGIHQIYEDLVSKGVRFNCPPQNLRPGVWATYMNDPEGNTIEIIQYQDE